VYARRTEMKGKKGKKRGGGRGDFTLVKHTSGGRRGGSSKKKGEPSHERGRFKKKKRLRTQESTLMKGVG